MFEYAIGRSRSFVTWGSWSVAMPGTLWIRPSSVQPDWPAAPDIGEKMVGDCLGVKNWWVKLKRNSKRNKNTMFFHVFFSEMRGHTSGILWGFDPERGKSSNETLRIKQQMLGFNPEQSGFSNGNLGSNWQTWINMAHSENVHQLGGCLKQQSARNPSVLPAICIGVSQGCPEVFFWRQSCQIWRRREIGITLHRDFP